MKALSLLLALGAALPATGAFLLVDDFDSLTAGSPLGGQGGWTAGTTWSVTTAPGGGSGNAALGAALPSGSQAAWKALGGEAIADTATGTLFYRIYRSGLVNISAGLSDDGAGALFGSFEAQLNVQQADNFKARNAGSFVDITPAGTFADATWYNVWMAADNAANTYDVYLSTGAGVPTLVADDFTFRNGAAANALDDVLLAIGFNAAATGDFYVDDIYIDSTSVNLANPVPEPAAATLLVLAGLGLIRRRR